MAADIHEDFPRGEKRGRTAMLVYWSLNMKIPQVPAVVFCFSILNLSAAVGGHDLGQFGGNRLPPYFNDSMCQYKTFLIWSKNCRCTAFDVIKY